MFVSSPRRRAMAAAGAVLLTWVTACSGVGPDPEQAGADLRYGAAPAPHPEVTFQPDVVLVAGGGGAVRSVVDGGLTWRLDPGARGAGDLAVGKVLFVTGRGVGRVVGLGTDGGDLVVTIGPVDITEVIRDGTFASPRPVALTAAVAHDAGEPFWADLEEAPADPSAGGMGGGGPASTDRKGDADRAGTAGGRGDGAENRPARVRQKSGAGMHVLPVCCAGGVGARFTYDDGGVRFRGVATLLMTAPSAGFALAIRGGAVTRAELQIHGGAGLRVEIEAATTVGNERNVVKRVPVPVDFAVPVGTILGVPFAATVNQWVTVKTAFTSKDASFKAAGEYSFGGTLGFGYAEGSFGARMPKGFATRNSMTDSITGVAIGVTGMIVTYQARFSIGIGAWGFTAGLYFGLTVSAGLTNGSSIGLVRCTAVRLTVLANYGVGYRIPAPVATVVNFFLRTFGTKPIENSGGIGAQTSVFDRSEVVPKAAICGT